MSPRLSEWASIAEIIGAVAIVISLVLDGDRSDQVKLLRGLVLYNMAMTLNDIRFQMMNAGYMSGWGEDLRQTVTMLFYEIWRRELPAQRRSQDFLDYADSLRETSESD